MYDMKFTIVEMLSLLGVVQCLYLLVYFSLRIRYITRVSIPFLYFFCLAMGFTVDLAERFLIGISPYYGIVQYMIWFLTVPFAVLLVIQIAKITRPPSPKYFLWAPIPFYALIAAFFLNGGQWGCGNDTDACLSLTDFFVVVSLLLCGLCVLSLLLQRGLLASIPMQKFGMERYWLVLSVIIVNVIFLVTMSGYYLTDVTSEQLKMVRTLLGISLIYLTTTSLFRIYPQSIRILDKDQSSSDEVLSDKDLEIAMRVERLLALEKVYHEPGYGRSDLARELAVPESLLSKIINVHFNKALPQLLNERRVADAKILLRDTDVPAKVIASEVGFNSLATFNRVFKDISGVSPSEYRAEH